MVGTQRRNDLKGEEKESESYAFTNWRYRRAGTMSCIRLSPELNNGLKGSLSESEGTGEDYMPLRQADS